MAPISDGKLEEAEVGLLAKSVLGGPGSNEPSLCSLPEREFTAFLGPSVGKPFAEKPFAEHQRARPYSGRSRKFKYLEWRLKTLVLVRCSHFVVEHSCQTGSMMNPIIASNSFNEIATVRIPATCSGA
jgi:hypothetical protein